MKLALFWCFSILLFTALHYNRVMCLLDFLVYLYSLAFMTCFLLIFVHLDGETEKTINGEEHIKND